MEYGVVAQSSAVVAMRSGIVHRSRVPYNGSVVLLRAQLNQVQPAVLPDRGESPSANAGTLLRNAIRLRQQLVYKAHSSMKRTRRLIFGARSS